MSKVVVWEIEQDKALVMLADLRGRTIRVEKGAVWPLAGADGASLGKRLQTWQVPQRAEMIVVVGRQDVEIKSLLLPPAPEDELPDMVRFQALREMSAGDSATIDFLTLTGDAATPRQVLAAALSPKSRAFIEAAALASGLKLVRIALHGSAVSACIRTQDSNGALIVEVRGQQAEIAAKDARGVRFLRTVRVGEHDIAQSLITEIRRTLTLLPSQAQLSPDEIHVACDDDLFAPLSTTWRMATGGELTRIEASQTAALSDGPEEVTKNLGLLGALLEHGEGRRHSFDFVNPRKAAAKPDQTKRYRIAGILMAGAAAAASLLYMTELRRQDAKLDSLRMQLRGAEKRMTELAPEMAKHEKLAAWKRGDVVWLDEMAALAKKLPDAESVALKSIVFKSAGGVTKHAAEVSLEGWAKDGEAVARFEDALRWDDTRSITPGRQSQREKPELGYTTDFKQITLLGDTPRRERYLALLEKPAEANPAAQPNAAESKPSEGNANGNPGSAAPSQPTNGASSVATAASTPVPQAPPGPSAPPSAEALGGASGNPTVTPVSPAPAEAAAATAQALQTATTKPEAAEENSLAAPAPQAGAAAETQKTAEGEAEKPQSAG